jgi:hypothetical protein
MSMPGVYGHALYPYPSPCHMFMLVFVSMSVPMGNVHVQLYVDVLRLTVVLKYKVMNIAIEMAMVLGKGTISHDIFFLEAIK